MSPAALGAARPLDLASSQVNGARPPLGRLLDLAGDAASKHAASSQDGRVILALVVGALVAVWAFRVVLFPFIECWWCGGNGKRRSKARRRTFGRCWICKGKGNHLRLSRRIFAHYKLGKVPR